MTSDLIHENELPCANGQRIGCLTLDHPKALNATNLEMIEALRAALARYEQNPQVVAIVIDATGDKALCAGGDIVNLRRAIIGEVAADYPYRFFTEEYRLCYELHQMTTPCIAWGHGIVMGGGCGLFMGASHRVVTETTRLAMPEIKIGLFPDCAATWFFNRLPAYLGRFIGLTGATLNAADCLFAGLAEHAIKHDHKSEVLAALQAARWEESPHATVAAILTEAERCAPATAASESRLARHADTIRKAAGGSELAAIVNDIAALADSDDAWLAECAQNLIDGCPMTAHLVHRQITEGRYLSLAETVQRELAMALACCTHEDFAEGVRALLIDKDRSPKWRHASVAEVPRDEIDAHFRPAWEGAHPLADLAAIPAVYPR